MINGALVPKLLSSGWGNEMAVSQSLLKLVKLS
jgi:hypothetical protein